MSSCEPMADPDHFDMKSTCKKIIQLLGRYLEVLNSGENAVIQK